MKILPVIFLFVHLSASAQSQIKAGAARVNITPPVGTIINGDFLPGYAVEIHDSLYAKALAFDNGINRVVFVVVDNMTIDALLVSEAKAIITSETGLAAGEIMISNTHSHSTGSVIETATVQADLSYRLFLPKKIALAAVMATKKLQPAKIAWGKIDVPRHVSCRRWYMKPGFPMINPFGEEEKVWMNPPQGSEYLDRPAGPVDPQLSFLAVKTLDDKWISVIANYSTHYVGGFPSNVISADYFGEVDVQLRDKLKAGNSFTGIMSNGTSGDINTFDFRQTRNYPTGNYQKMKLIAHEITDSIVKVLKVVRWNEKPELKVAGKYVNAVRRQPSPELLEWATARVKSTDYTKMGTADKASEDIKSLYALDIVKFDFYEPMSYDLFIQAIRIGEGAVGTLPGEIFAETGLNIRKNLPLNYYFTISHANGQYGYIPPASQFMLGGYETWLCSGSFLEPPAEEKLSDSLTEMIKSLY
ncbi:MAG: hypothetical protein HZB98_11315 [Bacteroidia bacterium]|nr:hypothetical protein [Bacteroidia bacterium]